MLRAFLRVGQRAVRIQLEQARTSGQDLSRTAGRVPVGGIPGFWVEKTVVPSTPQERGDVGIVPVKNLEVIEVSGEEEKQVVPVDGHPVLSVEERPIRDIQGESKSGSDESKIMSDQEVIELPKASNLERKMDVSPPVVPVEPPAVAVSEQPRETTASLKTDVSPPVVSVSQTAPSVSEGLRDGQTLEEPIPLDRGEVAEVRAEVIPKVKMEDSGSRIAQAEVLTTKEPTADSPISEEPIVEETLPAQERAVEEPEMKTPQTVVELDDVEQRPPQVILRPSKVPSSRIGRLFHYGSLVAGMSMGAAGEALRRTTGQSSQGSVFMSEANVRRLVDKLSKMRGAALKLGQFMSIQDTNVLPEQLEKVLQQVQANADYMPEWQLEQVLRAELGPDWESEFSAFPRVPIASASIGQVHSATLASTGMPVAVKVQFPGVEDSITSDLNNLSLLLRGSAVLPRGLFLNNTVKVFRGELADECNYEKEAENGRRMREYLKDEPFFEVPKVVDELSTRRVLTTELMSGRPLSEIKGFSQELRDKIGTAALRLCLLELFRYRLMQTDPNWANFLWDDKKQKLQLIDFGATREYSVEFMDKWYRLLKSVIDNDREAMREYSLKVGYLTGEENEAMLEAHLRSMELLAVPFTEETYDFGSQSVTDEVKKLIPTMLKYRLTPPPNETYSLNRKLSGSFLLCAKLGSRVNCRGLWEDVVGDYKVTSNV